jgi:hypothetical protein
MKTNGSRLGRNKERSMKQVCLSTAVLLLALGCAACEEGDGTSDADEGSGNENAGAGETDESDRAAGGNTGGGEELDVAGMSFWQLLVDGENLYLGTSFNPGSSTRGGIYRMPKDGSALPESVAELRGVEAMVRIDGHIVYKEHTSRRAGWLAGTGSPARMFELKLPVTGVGGALAPNWIVSDAQTAFMADLNQRCAESFPRTPFFKFAPPEEQASVLLQAPPCVRAITAHDGSLYYATAGATPNRIARMPAAGGAEQVVADNVEVDVFSMVNAGTKLYFTVQHKLYSAPLAGGAATLVEGAPSYVVGLFQSDELAIVQGNREFAMLSDAGLDVVGRYTDELVYNVRDVVVDDEYLYWLGSPQNKPTKLYRMPR